MSDGTFDASVAVRLSLAAWVREQLGDRGLEAAQLPEVAPVSRQWLARLESPTRKRDITFLEACAVIRALGGDPDSVLESLAALLDEGLTFAPGDIAT